MSACSAGAHENRSYRAGLLWALYSTAGSSNGPTLSSAINWSASRASITFSAGSFQTAIQIGHIVQGFFGLFLQNCVVSWMMISDEP